jgi:hypothetical protein
MRRRTDTRRAGAWVHVCLLDRVPHPETPNIIRARHRRVHALHKRAPIVRVRTPYPPTPPNAISSHTPLIMCQPDVLDTLRSGSRRR